MSSHEGHFKLKKTVNLSTLTDKVSIPESDYAVVDNNNNLMQFEYVPPVEKKPNGIEVTPGIFTIKLDKYKDPFLFKIKLPKEKLVEDYQISTKIKTFVLNFFNKLDVYKKHGIEQPKRGLIIYGVPGCGKTVSIRLALKELVSGGDTAVIFWSTDKYEASDMKEIFDSLYYSSVVKKLVLVAEDIGGVEYDKGVCAAESSLLSLLDNSEGSFTIPTAIIATTNFPETMLPNLTDRPGRFDSKIEVPKPTKEHRSALLKFFLKEDTTEEIVKEIESIKYDDFSAAHIKEVILRAELNEISYIEAMKELLEEQQTFKKAFQKKNKVGI